MKFNLDRVRVACCGSANYYYVTDAPISFEQFQKLEKVDPALKLNPTYKQYGLVFLDTKAYTLTAAIGSNKIRIQLKQKIDIGSVILFLGNNL
jgi:hypothetical protein